MFICLLYSPAVNNYTMYTQCTHITSTPIMYNRVTYINVGVLISMAIMNALLFCDCTG